MDAVHAQRSLSTVDAVRAQRPHSDETKCTVCHDRARPCTPSMEGPRTADLARDRPPTRERQRQAVGKQCTAVGELFVF
eukprot:4991591-Prymnesium_polylepis.1